MDHILLHKRSQSLKDRYRRSSFGCRTERSGSRGPEAGRGVCVEGGRCRDRWEGALQEAAGGTLRPGTRACHSQPGWDLTFDLMKPPGTSARNHDHLSPHWPLTLKQFVIPQGQMKIYQPQKGKTVLAWDFLLPTRGRRGPRKCSISDCTRVS